MSVRAAPLAGAERLVAEKLGIVLASHQENSLRSVLASLVRSGLAGDHSSVVDALARLDADSEPWQRIAEKISIGETSFFRHREWFHALVGTVLQPMLERRRAEGRLSIRIWSAACATGEEPYSLAIALADLIPDLSRWQILILGTDVNQAALERARRGEFRAWSLRSMGADYRGRHFAETGNGYFRLDAEIRRMVTFAPLNLAEDSYPHAATNTGDMDLIVCRNVLIYFSPELQRRVVGRLLRCLEPQGWIATSPAEASAALFRPLAPVNLENAIFFCRAAWSGKAPDAAAPPVKQDKNGDRDAGAASPRRRPARKKDAAKRQLSAQEIPESPQARCSDLLQRARTAADEGRLEDARDICRDVIAKNPLSTAAYLLLTIVCEELGDATAAAAAVRQALYLDPDAPEALYLHANVLIGRAEVARARRQIRHMIAVVESLAPETVVFATSGTTAADALTLGRDRLARLDARATSKENAVVFE